MKYTLHQNSGGFNASPNWDQVVSGEALRPLSLFCKSSFVLALLPFSSPLLFLRRSVVRPPPCSKISRRDARNQDLEGRTEVKVGMGTDWRMGCMGWVTA